METADATPEETALRETEEEIGLPRRHVEIVGRLARRETGTGFGVVPVVGLVEPPFPVAADSTEVAEIFEVPLAFLVDPANRRFETRIARGMERRFYAIPYRDYYIWGLTARLLVSLAERLGR
jgi:8-oxo-dGTP pyrophosphatase MutT (NUDIX family)